MRTFDRELLGVVSAAAVWLLAACTAAHAAPPRKQALAPAESLAAIRLADPRLEVELVAAEPEVIDPVAIAFDERGRMYVVEMRDYPNGPAKDGKPLSSIRLLEDRDGDGRYETSHTFCDNILFPTGVQPWQGGVIVTLAGRVAYMKDTDGDGKSDVDETWFTGFAEQNSQLRANHPTLGPDGFITIANGLRGGDVIARHAEWSAGAKPVSISSRDFRFHPLTGHYDAITGVGQFGNTFDDFGHRFVCSNRNPCQQVMLDEADLVRTPAAAIPAVMHDVSPAGEASQVHPLTAAWTTSTLHAGQFTAACGVTIFRGDALPAAYRGNAFTCEPTGSLVHRAVLEPDGPTFAAKKDSSTAEFLASTDEWFRPVNLANGPDGALYLVDMHRAVIEHPEFVPDELKRRPDERFGDDCGRIYRIRLKQTPRPQFASLAERKPAELAGALESSNAWQRDTAARLLPEGRHVAQQQALEAIAIGGKLPESRAAALSALKALGRCEARMLATALNDSDSRVRAVAVRLCRGAIDPTNGLGKAITDLAVQEADPNVRFELALRLGDLPKNVSTLTALARIAMAENRQPWTRAAVLTSLGDRGASLFLRLLAKAGESDVQLVDSSALLAQVAEVVGATADPDGAARTLDALAKLAPAAEPLPPARAAVAFSAANGLSRGCARRGASLRAIAKEAVAAADRIVVEALRAATAGGAKSTRLEAIELIRNLAPREKTPAILLTLGSAEADQDVRGAAIGALAVYPDGAGAAPLFEIYQSLPPRLRRAALEVFIATPKAAVRLLDEIERKRIAAAELDPSRVAALKNHGDRHVRERAKKVFAAATPADRAKVLADYQAALQLAGDAGRGREVFAKSCTACHRIGDAGVNVAPDIGDSRVFTPAQLLVDILDPNRKVDNNYFSYSAATKDGLTVTGILTNETATSITLKQQEGKTVQLLRDQIEELRSDGVSLMPVGLEKNVDRQQMADLIAYIKNWRYLDGRVPATPLEKARN